MIQSLKYGLFTSFFVWVCLSLYYQYFNKTWLAKGVAVFLINLSILVVIYLIVNHTLDHFTFLFILTGITLLVAIPMIFSAAENERKVIFFLGCFFLISYPLGSSDGIVTAGRYCLWIALPVALDYLLRVQSLQGSFSIFQDGGTYIAKQVYSERQFTRVKNVIFGLFLFAGFYHIYFYPFFDRRTRALMHYGFDSENLKGIYSTKGRADAINDLITASKKFVKPNDYVIAYDHIAMYYYATNTVPYLQNPLSSIYNADLFKDDLDSSYKRNENLPIIVRQKIRINGDASKWPEEIYPGDYSKYEPSIGKNIILDSFLNIHHYQEVWASRYFKILTPPNETGVKSFK
jgi:hypothetical protein